MNTRKTLSVSAMCFLLLFLGSAAHGENEYRQKKLHCSLAGRGDPWGSLTKQRLAMLMALHDGLDTAALADAFDISVERAVSELKPMQEANLVKKAGNRYAPDFFIADLGETNGSISTHEQLASRLQRC